jgi:hypothetical protein
MADSTEVELRDPSTGRWTGAGKLLEPRRAHSATVLDDGQVLVTGGYPPVLGTTIPLDSVELWDPGARVFRSAPPMNVARGRHAAIRLRDGRVFVVGGSSHDSTAWAEVWDPKTRRWTPAAKIPIAAGSPPAIELADGRVLVVGDHGYSAIWTPDASPTTSDAAP